MENKTGIAHRLKKLPRAFWVTFAGAVPLIVLSLLSWARLASGGAEFNVFSLSGRAGDIGGLLGFIESPRFDAFLTVRMIASGMVILLILSLALLVVSLPLKKLNTVLAYSGFGLNAFVTLAFISAALFINSEVNKATAGLPSSSIRLTVYPFLMFLTAAVIMVLLVKNPDRRFAIFNTAFMLFIVVIMLYPFLNQLAISFNNATDSIRGGIYLWPRIFTTHNYKTILESPLLFTAFRNSVLRTVISTAGGLFVCSMAGYILSRREFMFKKIVTIFFLLTMYVSPGLIPVFFLYRDLGLVNSFHVYWLPGLFGAFNVIVIRTYMQGLPDSLVEAARIDGAGEFRTFMQIVLPICKPVLATVGLWISVGNWNDWFTTFIFASRNDSLTTLQYELMKRLSAAMAQMSSLQSNHLAAQGDSAFQNITPIAIRATITIVAAVPILCVYPFLQKYFVKGVHVGSVKG